jgi:hypothetical protein
VGGLAGGYRTRRYATAVWRLKSRRTSSGSTLRFDYESAIRLLIDRGIDETVLRHNSILEPHLAFIRQTMNERLSSSRPLAGLHVGNFVGVSLAAFADALRNIHAESTVVAVDPNIDTPGLANPQQHVIATLESCGLLRSVVLVTGPSSAASGFGSIQP